MNNQIIDGDQAAETFDFVAGDPDEEPLSLKLELIDEASFLVYKNEYDDKITFDSSKVSATEDVLSIKTLAGEYQFQNVEFSNNNDFYFYSYSGFLAPLNLHLYVSESRIYTYLQGIDYLTGDQFDIDGFSRENYYGVCISKEENQLLTFQSGEEGDAFSYIKIYQLEENQATAVSGFLSEAWNTLELVWIDENSFALKTFKENDFDEKEDSFVMKDIQFFKATIIQ